MWRLVACALVLIACGNTSDPAPKEDPKAVPTGSAAVAPAPAGSAVVTPSAKPEKPAPPKLTKQQVVDVRKHKKAGWAAQHEKRWADAVTEFEAALKISDGDPRLLTELGWS